MAEVRKYVRTKKTVVEIVPIEFTQLLIQPWTDSDGKNQGSIVALGSDGRAYKFERQYMAWVAIPHEFVEVVRRG